MVDSPLVEGAICATMDLRRSVIFEIWYDIKIFILREVETRVQLAEEGVGQRDAEAEGGEL